MVRTPCRDENEIEAQRWLVSSFLDADFGLKRYEAADSMSTVYGLGHGQSRRLFDLTLVSIRRELLTDRPLAFIRPSSLARTRSEAIIRYVRFLSAEEFSRLACLLKDLAPSIVLTIDPTRACAIRRDARKRPVAICCVSCMVRRMTAGCFLNRPGERARSRRREALPYKPFWRVSASAFDHSCRLTIGNAGAIPLMAMNRSRSARRK
jgi:hypothetical protein